MLEQQPVADFQSDLPLGPDNQAEYIPPPPVDAKLTVSVSHSKMAAFVCITPPQYGGRNFSAEEITRFLNENRVVYGLIEDEINRLGREPEYSVQVSIASGLEPVNGENAYLEYKITRDRVLRPREREDGTVDYKDLGLVENVRKGDVLCVKIPATPGFPGTNVLGQAVPSRVGKDCILPAGKNTLITEDKLNLIAALDGQAEYVNNKINVLNTFVVNGNVSLETGNIVFVGNVVVNGNVLTGFLVEAAGNVDVIGVVEGARIVAGGNIIVRGGFNGVGRGELQAGGNISCKFIQSGKADAKGSVESGYAYNASIRAGEYISVIGKRGIIVGGHVMARTYVQSAFYGGRNSPIATSVEVGNDPVIMARSNEIPVEREACKKMLASAKRLQSILLQLEEAGRLDEDKRVTLEKTTNTVVLEENRLSDLENELIEVKTKLLESGYGQIKVQGSIYPGVRIVIGPEALMISSEQVYCCFSRSSNGITSGPLS